MDGWERQALDGLGVLLDKRPDFVLVVLPDDAEPIRRAVKFWGDIDRGVPTQCVVRIFVAFGMLYLSMRLTTYTSRLIAA